MKSNKNINRRKSLPVKVGNVIIGGDNPIVVQSMTDTNTSDIEKTTEQIIALSKAGSEVVRVTVNDSDAIKAIPFIRDRLQKAGENIPIVGDFHFNGHILLDKYRDDASYLDKFRINPGNVGKKNKKDIKKRENLLEFVNHVNKFFPNASGMPVVQFEAGNIVIKAFIFAFSVSLLFLITFILIIFRNLKILLLCVFPLFFGLALSIIIMKIINIDLNFANMIALPLLFSLGTSYSIYIVQRFLDLKSLKKLLFSSTPNAVF